MNDQKKIAAAMSAVMSYMEEEAALMASQEISEPAPGRVPSAPGSFWGVSGRQAQMQMRSLMQLKAFHRL